MFQDFVIRIRGQMTDGAIDAEIAFAAPTVSVFSPMLTPSNYHRRRATKPARIARCFCVTNAALPKLYRAEPPFI
jgi:hypothetical protein